MQALKWIVKVTSIGLVMAAPLLAANSPGSVRIKIDTVADSYSPASGETVTEPVSMEDFHFEINHETLRARVVVDYTYPDEIVFENNDDAGGPRRTLAQMPGLRYDPSAQEIVYEKDGHRTVCAQVQDQKGIFGRRFHIKNTGSCLVTSEDAKHTADNGWSIRHYRAIDVYFEVRPAE